MRVLILSCDTGGGHNACASAIHQEFAERGDKCDIADALCFVSDKLSKFVSWGHTVMYRHIPAVARAGYGFAERHPSLLEDETVVYKILTAGTERLHCYLQEGAYDIVICTHVFSGLLLRQTLKDYPVQIKTAFVATDYTCSPGVGKSFLDYYFIPEETLIEEFIVHGVPKEKIVPVGIPVRREFYIHEDRLEAKRKLGINESNTHLLVMCGSMGCGVLEKLTNLIGMRMDGGMEMSIVCGTNRKLYEEMTKKFELISNIHIYGFVPDISAMMDSADLYLTKPGGLSTTEAAAKCLPMVFINVVAGCEEFNMRYFVSLGGAVTADAPEELACLCLELMRNQSKLASMRAALESVTHVNAATRIYETFKSKAECNIGGMYKNGENLK